MAVAEEAQSEFFRDNMWPHIVAPPNLVVRGLHEDARVARAAEATAAAAAAATAAATSGGRSGGSGKKRGGKKIRKGRRRR